MTEWFDGWLAKHSGATRDELFSLAILLQQRYVFERRRSPQEQHDDLVRAHISAYDRWEELLHDTDLPLPAKPRRSGRDVESAPTPFGIVVVPTEE